MLPCNLKVSFFKNTYTYVVTHVERRFRADANALTTMANPLTRRAWNCLAPFTEIYVHISLHDIIKKPGR